jgi:hypothetical protein
LSGKENFPVVTEENCGNTENQGATEKYSGKEYVKSVAEEECDDTEGRGLSQRSSGKEGDKAELRETVVTQSQKATGREFLGREELEILKCMIPHRRRLRNE